jgi:hypothetical protein
MYKCQYIKEKLMSTETQEMEMGTKPVREHEWLRNFIGEWRVQNEMTMGPGQPKMNSEGRESVKDLGGLWAVAQGHSAMPGGGNMDYYATLGYDVSFKKYRGCWFASVSSHLWVQEGQLSADGKTLTLSCVGPDMVKDGETANYRFVFEIVDNNHRTMTEYGQDENGQWQEFIKSRYTRV